MTVGEQPSLGVAAVQRGSLPIAIGTFPLVHRVSVSEALSELAGLGHRRFEAVCAPGHLWPSELDAAARRILRMAWDTAGIELVSLNSSSLDQNIAGAAPETREHTLAMLRSVIGLASDLRVPAVLLPAGRVNPLLPAPRELVRRWLREGLLRAVELARGSGVQLLLENLPFGAITSADDLAAVVDEIADPCLAAAYDVANARFVGERPEAGLRILGSRLKLVHLADTGLNSWRHDPIGRGVVDFERIAVALRDVGFEGPSVIEMISAMPTRDIALAHVALAGMGWEAPPPEILEITRVRTQIPT